MKIVFVCLRFQLQHSIGITHTNPSTLPTKRTHTEKTITMNDRDDSYELELAITYWQDDEPLPLDIASRLLEDGYDVERLEEQYRP